MDLHKFGIKFFMTDPHAVPAQDFIPIFQHWIQGQVIPDHLLVDVHNYSHMHNGPGILLVAHEGNFSIDMADGRTGLLYIRKYPGKDLASIVKTARHACSLLEKEPALGGRVKFRTDEVHVVANDRLVAPNNDNTFSELQPVLSSALREVLGSADIQLSRISTDPKERLTVRVLVPQI